MVDYVNGTFEALGGVFIFLNVLKLHKDKKVRGVSTAAIGFFTTWGFWNLLYYPAIGQIASACAAGIVALVNLVWLGQIFYYNRKEKYEQERH
ncbi:hypothetical protein LCGC14_1296400 [marine sediment metagenome]|uniref:MtN3 and saliva related transmembrane protein n=1 Tax=marine sediment metagenome TaxID=412755 RepID=A0A0F9N7E3_9ZZZZ